MVIDVGADTRDVRTVDEEDVVRAKFREESRVDLLDRLGDQRAKTGKTCAQLGARPGLDTHQVGRTVGEAGARREHRRVAATDFDHSLGSPFPDHPVVDRGVGAVELRVIPVEAAFRLLGQVAELASPAAQPPQELELLSEIELECPGEVARMCREPNR